MGGPPSATYLGNKLGKELFMAMIVPVFLMVASSRSLTYGSRGMLDTNNLWLYVFPPLSVIIGNHIVIKFPKMYSRNGSQL